MRRRITAVFVHTQLLCLMVLGCAQHSYASEKQPPLLSLSKELECAANSDQAANLLKSFSGIDLPGMALPNEWYGSAQNPSLHAASLDIALYALSNTSARFPELALEVEQVILQWGYCEVLLDNTFYDFVSIGKSVEQRFADPKSPINWKGFHALGFLGEHDNRLVLDTFKHDDAPFVFYEVDYSSLFRQQCLPHPQTSKLYLDSDTYFPWRVVHDSYKQSPEYPFDWKTGCAVETQDDQTTKSPEAIVAEVTPVENDGKADWPTGADGTDLPELEAAENEVIAKNDGIPDWPKDTEIEPELSAATSAEEQAVGVAESASASSDHDKASAKSNTNVDDVAKTVVKSKTSSDVEEKTIADSNTSSDSVEKTIADSNTSSDGEEKTTAESNATETGFDKASVDTKFVDSSLATIQADTAVMDLDSADAYAQEADLEQALASGLEQDTAAKIVAPIDVADDADPLLEQTLASEEVQAAEQESVIAESVEVLQGAVSAQLEAVKSEAQTVEEGAATLESIGVDDLQQQTKTELSKTANELEVIVVAPLSETANTTAVEPDAVQALYELNSPTRHQMSDEDRVRLVARRLFGYRYELIKKQESMLSMITGPGYAYYGSAFRPVHPADGIPDYVNARKRHNNLVDGRADYLDITPNNLDKPLSPSASEALIAVTSELGRRWLRDVEYRNYSLAYRRLSNLKSSANKPRNSTTTQRNSVQPEELASLSLGRAELDGNPALIFEPEPDASDELQQQAKPKTPIKTKPKKKKFHGFNGFITLGNRSFDADGFSITTGASYKPIKDSYWFARSSWNYRFNDEEFRYTWGIGYDDWHPGTFSVQLNHWGPLLPGDYLDLDNAIASATYKFKKNNFMKKNRLSSSVTLSQKISGDPVFSWSNSWTPTGKWFVRSTISQPIKGGDLSWSYGFGYANYAPFTFSFEYNNWGYNKAFEYNFKDNGSLSFTYRWRY